MLDIFVKIRYIIYRTIVRPLANVISLSRREFTVGEYIRLSPQTWG